MVALPDNDRLAGPFIADPGQTDFPADFPLIDAAALRFERQRGGVSTILGPPDVQAVAIGEAGFTCRLTAPAQANDRCFVFTDLDGSRNRYHVPGGATLSDTLEGDAMGFAARIQELQRDLGRALLLPFGQGLKPPPPGTSLANGVFGVNAAGDTLMMRPGPFVTDVACTVTNEGTYWEMTPKTGFEVTALGADQFFYGIAPATPANSQLTIRVVGINDDEERHITLTDGSLLQATAIPPGTSYGVRYESVVGRFQLVWPAIVAAGDGVPFVWLRQVSRFGNIPTLEARPGFTLPNDTGYDVLMAWEVEDDPTPEAGWALAIAGITLDPLTLQYPDNSTVEPTRPQKGSIIFVTRNKATHLYTLLQVWDANTAKGGGGGEAGGGLTAYQRVIGAWAAQNARDAGRLARNVRDGLAAFMATFTAAGTALITAATPAAQRTALGLASMAEQASTNVTITGGTARGLTGVQVTGTVSASGGSGLEINGGASVLLQAYNRTGAAYIGASIDASSINLRPNGTARLSVTTNGVQVTGGTIKAASYTVGTVPSAASHGAGSTIYVSDAAGGAEHAYSDGTNWKRFSDRTTLS